MGTAAETVSIGLPVYNGERFLARSLDSLLAQTMPDFELIISDNASIGWMQNLPGVRIRDRRIRYVRNEHNVGVYRNFNKVFELSRGNHFKWAAADDFAEPRLLERCLGRSQPRAGSCSGVSEDTLRR